MMNVYKYIRDFAESAEVEVSTGDVAKIAATLRAANLRGGLDEREKELARPIVAVRIGRIAGSKGSQEIFVEAASASSKEEKDSPSSSKKEDKIVEGYKDSKTFEKIDAMVKRGKCARCGKPTDKVSLATYEEVYYCPQCRTTLW